MTIRTVEQKLLSTDEATRIAAADAILSDPCNFSRLLAFLCERFREDQSPSVRWRIAEALGAMRILSNVVVQTILAGLHDPAYYVRWHCRLVLRRLLSRDVLISKLLELMRWDSLDDVRLDAIDELIVSRAQHATAEAVLAYTARHDCNASVRAKAQEALCLFRCRTPEAFSSYRSGLSDSDNAVRIHAARACVMCGETTSDVVEVLGSGLAEPLYASQAWSALEFARIAHPSIVRRCIRNLTRENRRRYRYESQARGLLPTIGMKFWHKPMPVEIPSRGKPMDGVYPWVWEDLGVFHGWRGHAHSDKQNTTAQICFHADWFPRIHFIALTQLIAFQENEKLLAQAPATLEGSAVGFLLQGGGALYRLDGMREVRPCVRTERVDFTFGFRKDMQATQLLMFAGLARHRPSNPVLHRLERTASRVWSRFESAFSEILIGEGLSMLAASRWYTSRGRPSIRYGIRYERPYEEFVGALWPLQQLFSNSRGKDLRKASNKLVASVVRECEAIVSEHARVRLS